MKREITRSMTGLAAVLLLAACASRNVRVNCDAHLQPINPAAAMAHPSAQSLAAQGSAALPSQGRTP